MKKFKSSSKNNSSKKNVQIKNDKNSKVILERSKYFPEYDIKSTFKIINDPNKPFIQMEMKKK
jgi:sucrose-6-phosphate hydrolase SacC (GH32 family)